MQRLLVLLGLMALAVSLAAGTAQAKLTPTEERWAKPLISIWNVQNAGLHLVLKQAAAKDALLAGQRPNNLALTKTLFAFVSCTTPKDLVAAAGAPPSPRLATFRDALAQACTHDANGAHLFAKAVGAYGKGKGQLVQQYLASGVAEFKLGSAAVSRAYRALIAIGGKSIFTA